VSPRQPVVSGKALVRAPLHKEIRKGTLAGILRDAGLSADRLRELL
jgi:hypothetical protein